MFSCTECSKVEESQENMQKQSGAVKSISSSYLREEHRKVREELGEELARHYSLRDAIHAVTQTAWCLPDTEARPDPTLNKGEGTQLWT